MRTYVILVGLVALQRLVELGLARRNTRRARARGAVETGARHYPWMVLLHTLFLVSCPLEVWALERPLIPWLAASSLAVLGAATALRYWVIRTLGARWTTRVLWVPGDPMVKGGPYRFLRHPNYVAVVVELAALPLVHSAWATAALFSVLNGVMLAVRLRTETAHMQKHAAGGAPKREEAVGR